MAANQQSPVDYVLIHSKYLSDEDNEVLSEYVKSMNQQGLTTSTECGEVKMCSNAGAAQIRVYALGFRKRNPNSTMESIFFEIIKEKYEHRPSFFASFWVLDQYICIKVQAPDAVLDNLAEVFEVALAKNNPHYKSQKIRWTRFANILTNLDEDDPVFKRGRAELLSTIKYGHLPEQKGFQSLIKKGVLVDAFPLHSSTYKWTEIGPLSDRQLLAKYWANLKCFYNYQPLNLIEKHYGPEIGFYFAWMGFYNQLLVPAAIMGLLCFFAGIILYFVDTDYIQREVCESNQLICPVCPSATTCDAIPLRDSCDKFKIAYVLENPITVDYSILMIFWGVIFMISWRRKEAMLRMRWDIHPVPDDRITRSEFINAASLNRISSITGEKEYYYPMWRRLLSYTVSYSFLLVVFFGFFIGLMAVILFRLHFMEYARKSRIPKRYVSMIEMFSSSSLSILLIYFFRLFKNWLSRKLTQLENPRTHGEFRMRYRMKTIIFSFANVLFPMVYLAYFKGKFFTHPGDKSQWTFFGMSKKDLCEPSGCFVDLSIQLMMIMGVENAVRFYEEYSLPYLKVLYKRIFYKFRPPRHYNKQWEEDFNLIQLGESFLDDDYIDFAVQHGYMSFFLVAFPLAPVVALVNNVLKLRFDAMKLLIRSRRAVPRHITGIEEWNTLFQVVTVLGTIANPLLITFGSNFVPKIMYRIQHGNSLSGFVNSTLSEFAIDDFPGARSMDNVDTCQYFSRRYPPTHPKSYQLTSEFWLLIAVKSLVFIVLENICLLFALFLNYVVPTIPRKVEIKIEYERQMVREMKLKRNNI